MRHRRPTAPSVTSRPLASLALLALLTALPITGFPANGGRASSYADPENEDNRPIEKDVELPPFPKSENLIPFFVSTTTTNKFMIDGESLTLDTDDLIRYTLVISSPSGALNTSYEGIRCATAERRLYATGRSDQTWAKVNTDKWIRIHENSLNRHHAALYKDYFCPVGVPILDPEDIRRALRRGGHPMAGQH